MDTTLPTQESLQPQMSEAEVALMDKYTPDGCILEFGAGGSSAFFAKKGVRQLISVESDREWINRMLLSNSTLREWAKARRWCPFHAQIGATGEWGFPLAQEPEVAWLNYHQAIWNAVDALGLDFVLVDGRFRVACALQLLLRSRKKTPRILVHDFTPREYYHVLLKFFDVIEQADTAVILERKEPVLFADVALYLQLYQFDKR